MPIYRLFAEHVLRSRADRDAYLGARGYQPRTRPCGNRGCTARYAGAGYNPMRGERNPRSARNTAMRLRHSEAGMNQRLSSEPVLPDFRVARILKRFCLTAWRAVKRVQRRNSAQRRYGADVLHRLAALRAHRRQQRLLLVHAPSLRHADKRCFDL